MKDLCFLIRKKNKCILLSKVQGCCLRKPGYREMEKVLNLWLGRTWNLKLSQEKRSIIVF